MCSYYGKSFTINVDNVAPGDYVLINKQDYEKVMKELDELRKIINQKPDEIITQNKVLKEIIGNLMDEEIRIINRRASRIEEFNKIKTFIGK